MAYDKALVAGKLRRWEKYLDNYRLGDRVILFNINEMRETS